MASPRCLKLLTNGPSLLMTYQSFSRRMASKVARLTDKRITTLPDEILNSEICRGEVALMQKIHEQFSSNKSEFKKVLLKHPESQAALVTIMKKLRFLRPFQVQALAHTILANHLPINMGICKGIMQMLRVHLNEYDANALADIYRLLVHVKSVYLNIEEPKGPESPLLNALLKAIPKALEIKIIGKQFHADDPDQLLRILRVAVQTRVSVESISFLLNNLSRKLHRINPDGLNELILHLSDTWIETNVDELGRPLICGMLNQCFTQVSKFLEKNNYEMDYYFDKTLQSLFSTSDPMYYNAYYCDTIYKVTERLSDLTNLQAFDAFLAFCLRYDHFSVKAIEKISELIVADPDEFLWNCQLSSANIVQVLGRLNWKPPNVKWESFSTILFDSAKVRGSDYYSPIEIMKSFLILGEHQEFEIIAEQDAVNYLSTPTVRTIEEEEAFYRDLLTINIATSLEAESFTPDEVKSALEPLTAQAIQYFHDKGSYTEFQECLSSFLKLTFGGPQFVATNVWTRHGHHIDNLVAINEDGHPVALEKVKQKEDEGVCFLENFEINPEHSLIAVLPLTDYDICYRPFKIKGEVQLKLRTLEQLGIKPLRIHFDSWDTLSDREKCPYLLREIQELTETRINQEIFKKCVSL